MRLMKLSCIGLLLALSMAAVGCQSSGSTPAASESMAPSKAVAITTGQGTTTVYVPSSTSPTGVARLAGDKEGPVCKQCEEDAANYFKTGTISPKCPVCGATRVPLHSVN